MVVEYKAPSTISSPTIFCFSSSVYTYTARALERIINAFVRHSLRTYLEGVETVALTSEKLRGYVRWFLERQTDRFGQILVAMGHKDGMTMEATLAPIKDWLWKER